MLPPLPRTITPLTVLWLDTFFPTAPLLLFNPLVWTGCLDGTGKLDNCVFPVPRLMMMLVKIIVVGPRDRPGCGAVSWRRKGSSPLRTIVQALLQWHNLLDIVLLPIIWTLNDPTDLLALLLVIPVVVASIIIIGLILIDWLLVNNDDAVLDHCTAPDPTFTVTYHSDSFYPTRTQWCCWLINFVVVFIVLTLLFQWPIVVTSWHCATIILPCWLLDPGDRRFYPTFDTPLQWPDLIVIYTLQYLFVYSQFLIAVDQTVVVGWCDRFCDWRSPIIYLTVVPLPHCCCVIITVILLPFILTRLVIAIWLYAVTPVRPGICWDGIHACCCGLNPAGYFLCSRPHYPDGRTGTYIYRLFGDARTVPLYSPIYLIVPRQTPPPRAHNLCFDHHARLPCCNMLRPPTTRVPIPLGTLFPGTCHWPPTLCPHLPVMVVLPQDFPIVFIGLDGPWTDLTCWLGRTGLTLPPIILTLTPLF